MSDIKVVIIGGAWRGAFEDWLPTSDAFKHVPKRLPGLDRFYMAGQWVEPGGAGRAVLAGPNPMAIGGLHVEPCPI